MDKFLYCRLTETALPHIAIFLNDVQRKKAKRQYYCDIRPNMVEDALLSQYIKTMDHFFYAGLWELLDRPGQTLDEIAIQEEDDDSDAE